MLLTLRRASRCLALALAASCMPACAERLRPDECAALLDQYVNLLARSDRPGTTEGEILKLQMQAREKAANDPAFRRCSREVSRRQFECALEAHSTDRFEQCML